MFGRLEQNAIREMIAERAELLARVAKLEADLERTNLNFAKMSEAVEAAEPTKERRRGRA
jgi:hypothetical protein